MKFTVFAVIAAFCLVAVSANATGDIFLQNELMEDMELISQDLAEEIAEIEPNGAFTGMYFVIKKALRYVKGLNCTIKEVLAIQTAAQNFVDSVRACGGEVSKKVQNLIDACNDIIQTCKEILGINETICGNSNDVEESSGDDVESHGVISKAKTAHKCFVKMVRKVNKLKKQVKRAIKMIKSIKKVPGDTSDCVMDAVNNLEMYFTQFPANIKTCSKLTSK
ncbi:uncharacterized protein LOC133333561 [Musca vetustissima]|uniref:uncharacterized protein LOC133333561 n=1 Tax=Musca vetustissima TaxID=27455 RepID=UPI002AB7EFD8|nr:uncharacterized protein LOC133333561 [Musca vetustissima]